jgi:hypothetical protein
MKTIPYNKEGTYITTRSFLDFVSVGLEDFEPTYPNVMVSIGNLEDLDGDWELVAQSCNNTIIFWTWKFCLCEK